MDTIMQFVQQHKTSTTLIGGIVLGLLLGMIVFWGIWPLEMSNATPGHLRWDFQDEYLVWVAEQYASSGDLQGARTRLGAEYWETSESLETLATTCEDVTVTKCGAGEAMHLRVLAQALETTAPSEGADAGPSLLQRLFGPTLKVCGALLLVVLLIAGVWFVVSRLRASRAETAERGGAAERFPMAEPTSWGPDGPPLAQFPTTYTLGDDHYDPSFSVEMESGEFMGECGVGVSETIGVGAPNKVTAFEVWLFDKSDIRTVTKVLMSDYAFHDEALRAKLAPKGEPMLVKAGEDVVLETKTLRVRVRIAEVSYGMGNLPPNSFFERLAIDLVAWVKPAQGGMEAAFEESAIILPPAI